MDWDELRFVLAVERHKTLTDAAETLGVTRTTVGRRLKEAEKRLGVRLFDRTPEGLVPTAEGSELAAAAARVEGEVHAAEGRILGRDAELKGGLRVSTLEFIFTGFPEIFGDFVERYPGIELTVGISNEPVSLMRREADVALRLGNTPKEHLIGRKIARLEFEAYASRALVARVGAGSPPNAYPWLNWDERSDNAWYDVWLNEVAPDARIAMRCGDLPVARAAVRAGIGASLMPAFVGDSDPDLVRLGVRYPHGSADLWALTLPDLRHNSRIRAFMEHVQEAFRPHRALLDGSGGSDFT